MNRIDGIDIENRLLQFCNKYLPFIFILFPCILIGYLCIHEDPINKEVVGDLYHSEEFFSRNYEAMERDFKVFVYPSGNATPCYRSTDHKLKSKYASEHYFIMNLIDSGFLTDDPHEAHLFFIPISCRNQVENRKSTRRYVEDLISHYPYWKRTFGVDHFYVSCQNIGSRADEAVPFLLKNAIRLVCSPSYDSKYFPNKDIALPQILELSLPPSADSPPPHHGYDMWNRSTAELPPFLLSPGKKHPPRTKLAFWAGSLNSEVRNSLEIFYKGVQGFEFHSVGKMKRRAVLGTYQNEVYGSKFCMCPRGKTQVGGVCLSESMTFGCVPVIMSNYYDLPFNDILNWNNFSVILKEEDVPDLEKILTGIPEAKFKKMRHNVLQVHKHFKWNSPPVKYDEFHMVMYELWQRRHITRY